jgi:transcriptional regulator with XRE-family HTH domain
MPRRLPQYLKQERRRAGLSQADVAYLFGARAKTKVSRYERGRHLPPLRTALAYEAMLSVPVAQLFPAAFTAVRRSLRIRAKRRIKTLMMFPESARNVRRKRSLEKLLTQR